MEYDYNTQTYSIPHNLTNKERRGIKALPIGRPRIYTVKPAAPNLWRAYYKTPCSFSWPMKITPQLQEFLGTGDKLLCRTDIIKRISKWVKRQDIYKQDDRRKIRIYSKKARPLRKLFHDCPKKNDPEADNFTIFKMQKYIQHHFLEYKHQL